MNKLELYNEIERQLRESCFTTWEAFQYNIHREPSNSVYIQEPADPSWHTVSLYASLA